MQLPLHRKSGRENTRGRQRFGRGDRKRQSGGRRERIYYSTERGGLITLADFSCSLRDLALCVRDSRESNINFTSVLSTSPSRQDRKPAEVDCRAAPTEGPTHHVLWLIWAEGNEVELSRAHNVTTMPALHCVRQRCTGLRSDCPVHNTCVTSLFILKMFFHSCFFMLLLCNIANVHVAQRTFEII